MYQPSKFWDRFAVRYSKSPIADQESYEKKLQITRKYLRSGMEILEFGCGTGSTAILHAPYVKHIHAIDASPRMIEIAQGKADAENVRNITFEQSAIDGFSGADESLDAVLGLSILHLLDNKEEVIAKVHKMLKAGGVFVSSTACLGGTMKFLKIILSIGRCIGLLPLVKFFTSTELEKSLTDAGFGIDYQWQPGKGKSVFIVAKKAAV